MKAILALLSIGILIFTVTVIGIVGKKTINQQPEKLEIEQSVLGVQDTQTKNQVPVVAIDRNVLYGLINAYRKENSLNALTIHPSLELSAYKKLQDMLSKEYYAHQDVNGTESWYLFKNSGYAFSQAGENLSFAHNTSWRVLEAWMQSKEHNRQLLKPDYIDMGIAIDCENYEIAGKKNCVVVLHLGTK